MGKLGPVTWQKFEKFLCKQGCRFERQTASHRVYWKPGLQRPLVVPKRKELPVYVIRNNIRLLGISVEDYLKFLDQL